ncbi:hypothetical protein D9M72_558910 [compost metagenome]
MVVGNDDAVLADDHAGSERGLFLAAVRHALPEELLEEGIAGEDRPALDRTLGIDVDDRIRRLLDQRGEGKLHLRARLRYGLRILGHCRTRQRDSKNERRKRSLTKDHMKHSPIRRGYVQIGFRRKKGKRRHDISKVGAITPNTRKRGCPPLSQ